MTSKFGYSLLDPLMKTPLIKDATILRLLDRLKEHLGPGTFDVVDHWESDLCAIGVARPDNPRVLVYISTFRRHDDTCFVGLELPAAAGSDPPYTQAGERVTKNFGELLTIIQRHLNQ